MMMVRTMAMTIGAKGGDGQEIPLLHGVSPFVVTILVASIWLQVTRLLLAVQRWRKGFADLTAQGFLPAPAAKIPGATSRMTVDLDFFLFTVCIGAVWRATSPGTILQGCVIGQQYSGRPWSALTEVNKGADRLHKRLTIYSIHGAVSFPG
jgi:hypothetical protein